MVPNLSRWVGVVNPVSSRASAETYLTCPGPFQAWWRLRLTYAWDQGTRLLRTQGLRCPYGCKHPSVNVMTYIKHKAGRRSSPLSERAGNRLVACRVVLMFSIWHDRSGKTTPCNNYHRPVMMPFSGSENARNATRIVMVNDNVNLFSLSREAFITNPGM